MRWVFRISGFEFWNDRVLFRISPACRAAAQAWYSAFRI